MNPFAQMFGLSLFVHLAILGIKVISRYVKAVRSRLQRRKQIVVQPTVIIQQAV